MWLKSHGLMVCVAWLFALRLALAVGTEIYPDEAYYWTWAQHPQLGYFDHPALIAWSIAVLGIRTGALLWGALALAGVHRLTIELDGSSHTAWWATALFASSPAACLLGTISTPDAPLLACWVWTLVALVRGHPVFTGLLWGLSMLSKYNGILLGIPVLLVFYRRPRHLAVASLLALAVTSPTLLWNAAHDWEGFKFQLGHGLGGGGSLSTFLEFLLGQLAMGGPIVTLLTLWWLLRGRAIPLLKIATLLPLVFFGFASWKARGEANWAAASWLSASVGLALSGLSGWRRAGLALNVAVTSVGAALLIFPPRQIWETPAIQKLHGWSFLRRAAAEKIPVITSRYQLSALSSYYAGVPATTFGGRRSQYDFWPRPEIPPGTDALWVAEAEAPPPELVERFETSTQLDWPLDQRQHMLHPLVGFRLGRAKPPP